MPDFPPAPVPSSISAPEVIDPMLSFQSDFGYEVRRVLHPRPRFRYTLEWLGKTTHEMRYIRDFLMFQRLGTLPFSWHHNTGQQSGVVVANTTPIVLTYPTTHGLVTGMHVYLFNAVGVGAGLQAVYRVTRLSQEQLLLDGSTAAGAGTVGATVYLPRAVARFPEGTMPSPVKLIGPENGIQGFWNFSLQIEEIF